MPVERGAGQASARASSQRRNARRPLCRPLCRALCRGCPPELLSAPLLTVMLGCWLTTAIVHVASGSSRKTAGAACTKRFRCCAARLRHSRLRAGRVCVGVDCEIHSRGGGGVRRRPCRLRAAAPALERADRETFRVKRSFVVCGIQEDRHLPGGGGRRRRRAISAAPSDQRRAACEQRERSPPHRERAGDRHDGGSRRARGGHAAPLVQRGCLLWCGGGGCAATRRSVLLIRSLLVTYCALQGVVRSLCPPGGGAGGEPHGGAWRRRQGSIGLPRIVEEPVAESEARIRPKYIGTRYGVARKPAAAAKSAAAPLQTELTPPLCAAPRRAALGGLNRGFWWGRSPPGKNNLRWRRCDGGAVSREAPRPTCARAAL